MVCNKSLGLTAASQQRTMCHLMAHLNTYSSPLVSKWFVNVHPGSGVSVIMTCFRSFVFFQTQKDRIVKEFI